MSDMDGQETKFLSSSGQRISDRGLWWGAMAVLFALAAYMAAAESTWGLAMGSALGFIAVLLNHKRLVGAGKGRATRISLILIVIVALTLAAVHFIVGPSIRG